jgi:hypothetical protein
MIILRLFLAAISASIMLKEFLDIVDRPDNI